MMNAEGLSEQQLEILRYVRDHAVATAETIAREVLQMPVTTFGRRLRRRAAGEKLAVLVDRGLLWQNGDARHAEFMLTQEGRGALRSSSLDPQGSDSAASHG
jgi:hypothetical protein